MKKYIQSNCNWSTGPWYDAQTGGNIVSKPGVGDEAYLDPYYITLDEDITCDRIVTTGTTTSLNISGDRILNTDIICSGGYSSGMINAFSYQGASSITVNGRLETYKDNMLYCYGCGVFINSSDIALKTNSVSTGRCIRSLGGNTIAISGDVICESTLYTIEESTNDKITIIGDLSAIEGGTCVGGNGELTIRGKITGGIITKGAVDLSTGVLNWIGDYTIEESEKLYITLSEYASGIIFANDDGVLNLTVNGDFYINGLDIYNDFYLQNETHGSASIVQNLSTSNVFVNASGLESIVQRPTYPDVSDVKSGVTYGYPGELQTGTLQEDNSRRVSLIKLST